MKTGNDLIRHGAIVLAGTLGANVLFYVFHFAMSRLLGVSDYGSMLSLFSLVILVGIPALVAQTLVAKTISGYVDSHRLDRIRRFVRQLIPWASCVAVAVSALLCLSRFALANFLHARNASSVLLVAWAVMFYLIVPILYGILQGEQRFRALAISLVTDALARAAFAIFFVERGFGVNGALLAIAIGATCATILAAWFVSDLARKPALAIETQADTTDIWTSLQLSTGILVISCLASADIVLVKHFRSAYEAGLFGSLALIGRIVYLIASFVPTIVLPKAARRMKSGLSPVPLLFQAAAIFVLTSSSVLVPLLIAPAFVLRLVAGSAYANAAPLLAMYASAIAFLAAAYAAANYNIGVNRLRFVFPVLIIGCAEIGIISLHHDSLAMIVTILAYGHFSIFIATIFRIWVHADPNPAFDKVVLNP